MRRVALKIILHLYKTGNRPANGAKISRETNTTYSVCSTTFQTLKSLKLITLADSSSKRENIWILTIRGQMLCKELLHIDQQLKENPFF